MSGYTSDQVNALQGYINAAQTALNSGNNNGVISALNQYYGAQTSMRGYATDALQVLNNTGVFGHVANQELINSLGQDRYNSIRTTLAFDLANSDLSLIKNHPNAAPTENEIANYHSTDFKNLNIDPTAWGGATGAALGADWAQGTLTAAEIDPDLAKNAFSQTFTSVQTLSAMNKLIQAGLNTIPVTSSADIVNLLRGFRDILIYQEIYDLKYNVNVFQWDPSKINYNSSSQTITSGQNGSQFLTVVTSADNNGILYVGSAITQSDGSTGLYLASTGASITNSEPFATVTSTSAGTESQFALTAQPNQNQIVLSDQTTGSGTNFALTARYNPVSGGISSETVTGNSFQLNSSGSNINFASGSTGKLIGDFDDVNVGNSATIALAGQGGTITATYASLNLGANSNATVSGQNNVVTLQANGNDQLTVTGQNQTVNGDSGNNGVSLIGTGTSATVNGAGTVDLTGSNENLTLGNSGATVNVNAGLRGEGITGSGETITFAGNTWGTVNGAFDAINGPNGGDRINIDGVYDHFSGSYDSVNMEGPSSGDTANGAWDNYYNQGLYIGRSDGSEENEWSGKGDADGDNRWDDPLVVNLDHAAVQTVDVDQSPASFDMQNDGQRVRTGWGTAGEGYLVDATKADGDVNSAADLVPSFAALESLDTNHDGVLDAHDTAWSNLEVWVDTTGTAAFQPGSLHSLGELGIVSIDLNATPDQHTDNGNMILADSSFTWADGSKGDIADVAFRFSANQPSASPAAAVPDQTSQTQTQAAQLVAAMSTFDVGSAPDSGVQTVVPSAQASLAIDPTAAQAHRLAA